MLNIRNKFKLSSTQFIIAGFIGIILTGTVLLMMPFSSADGSFTPFDNAFFMATTSVCVTGLTTLTTAVHWSFIGKVIILILIQLGGLGVVCVGIGIMIIIKKRITLKERILIQEAYNLDNIDGMVRLIKKVIIGAFFMEAIGAVLYSTVFIPDYGLERGLWYSVFHSISAFCNAGIDILGEVSFEAYRTNIIVNLTTMILIVTGGIGFIVWWDIKKVFVNAREIKKYRGQLFARLDVHSKIAIVMTSILIILGATVIFVMEYNNSSTIGDLSLGNKIMVSFFESITTRTAGFATVNQSLFRDGSAVIIMLFMFIGGSPMGTAGGLKTTTVAMILLSVRGTIKGRRETEVFDRRISRENIKTGQSVIALGFIFAITAIIVLTVTEDVGLKDITFEVMSALGTVGLTRGLTPELSVSGKFIIALVMFAGRLGPITLAMGFSKKYKKTTNLRELAQTKIMVG